MRAVAPDMRPVKLLSLTYFTEQEEEINTFSILLLGLGKRYLEGNRRNGMYDKNVLCLLHTWLGVKTKLGLAQTEICFCSPVLEGHGFTGHSCALWHLFRSQTEVELRGSDGKTG